MRRPSLHEKDKDAMSAKDARDEARHVVEMMAAAINNEDEDGEDEDMKTETDKVCSHVQGDAKACSHICDDANGCSHIEDDAKACSHVEDVVSC